MMAVKSAISFGLVHIPVSLHTAVKDHDIQFNQLHKADSSRIRYKKVCGHCGREVKAEDIVKGFEYDKDQYVVVTDDDFEAIKTEKDRSLHILHFANLDQISPVYYDKTYHAVPESGGEKAFELLRVALMEEQKIAVAKTVLGSKETLTALIPREDGLLTVRAVLLICGTEGLRSAINAIRSSTACFPSLAISFIRSKTDAYWTASWLFLMVENRISARCSDAAS